MNIVTSVEHRNVPVTILRPDGRVDGENYGELITKAAEVYELGARDILLDMSEVSYISSAGVIALHTIALLLEGLPLPDLDDGWHTIKRARMTPPSGRQKHLKLLNMQPEVRDILDMLGFTAYLEAFEDKETALRAF